MSTTLEQATDRYGITHLPDVAAAVRNTVEESGFTYDELEEQHRTGHFQTTSALLAWHAVGGLRGYLV